MNVCLPLAIIIFLKNYSHEIVKWFGTLLIAIITALFTAWFSIRKYYREQRISRLQKLYLEGAFLGQAKAMEKNMSHLHANLNPIKILLQYASDDENKLFLEQKKKVFLNKIEIIEKQMMLNVIQTDFKKETISQFLCEAGYHDNKLVYWIKIFEDNIVAFQNQLDIFFISFKTLLLDPIIPDEIFLEEVKNIQIKIDNYYPLIQRHYILLRLVSNIIFNLNNEHYSSKSALKKALKSKKYEKSIKLGNELYTFLEIKTTDAMRYMDENDANRLNEKIKLARKKIEEELFSNKNFLLKEIQRYFLTRIKQFQQSCCSNQ